MLLSAVQELNAKLTRNEAKLEKLTHAEQSEDGVSTGGLGQWQGCLTSLSRNVMGAGIRNTKTAFTCVPVFVCLFACCRV